MCAGINSTQYPLWCLDTAAEVTPLTRDQRYRTRKPNAPAPRRNAKAKGCAAGSLRVPGSRQINLACAALLEEHLARLVLRAKDEIEPRKRVVRDLLVGHHVMVVVQAREVRASLLALGAEAWVLAPREEVAPAFAAHIVEGARLQAAEPGEVTWPGEVT